MPIGSPPSAQGGRLMVGRLDAEVHPMGSRTESIETQ